MSYSLSSTLEAILFVSSRAMTVSELSKAAQKTAEEVQEALQILANEKNIEENGIWLMDTGSAYVLSSAPHMAGAVSSFIRDEAAGELTKAQLETLTVIAYKGPMTRSEIEQLRGVNCAVILRILLVRDLIAEEDGPLEPLYSVSSTALAHLGVTSARQLPEYEELHNHEHLSAVMPDKLAVDNQSAAIPEEDL